MVVVEASCQVCGDKTTATLSGFSCCNACNSAYRRIEEDKRQQLRCINGGRCGMRRCRACRFQKTEGLVVLGNSRNKLLKHMHQLHLQRETMFMNYKPGEGFKMDLHEAMRSEIKANLVKSGPVTFEDSATMSQLATIDFFKEMPFYKDLSAGDQEAFVRANRFKSAFLFLGMHSFVTKAHLMQFPNGTSIFPFEIISSEAVHPKYKVQVLVKLYNKFLELKVTSDEYCIISGLSVCNPNIDNLSPNGQKTIQAVQKAFFDLLVHVSLQNHGPNRFSRLTEIQMVLETTYMDYEYILLLHSLQKFMETSKVEVEDRDSILRFE